MQLGGAGTQKDMNHECLSVAPHKNYDNLLGQLRATVSGNL